MIVIESTEALILVTNVTTSLWVNPLTTTVTSSVVSTAPRADPEIVITSPSAYVLPPSVTVTVEISPFPSVTIVNSTSIPPVGATLFCATPVNVVDAVN